MTGSGPPGPPPSPPANFNSRPLTSSELATGAHLIRIHQSKLDPLYFGRSSDFRRRQRWYAPDEGYGVAYLAHDLHTALAETLVRDLPTDVVQKSAIAIRSLTVFEAAEPIRLAMMHGEGLRAHGADASVVHGPYEGTWDWSRAIHDHPAELDGVCYRARHDDSGLAIALFERAQAKVTARSTMDLLTAPLEKKVLEWLDRCGVGVTP